MYICMYASGIDIQVRLNVNSAANVAPHCSFRERFSGCTQVILARCFAQTHIKPR